MKKVTIHTAALLAMFFWGISFILSKQVFEQYTPLTTIFFRLIISFVFLFGIILVSRKWERIDRKDAWLFFVSSIFNPFLYFIGENYGLHQVSASITAFIIATIPLFTPFIAFKVFGEKLSRMNILGLLFAFIGILLIIFNPDLSMNASLEGILLLFLAVFSAVIYTVFLKKLSFKYRATTIIGWQNLIGAAYFLPLFLFFDFEEVATIEPHLKVISSLLMLGVFASSLAFVMFTYVIKYIGISKANIYTNLVPVFTGITAFIVLEEHFTLINLMGMAIIILGVTLSQIERKKQIAF